MKVSLRKVGALCSRKGITLSKLLIKAHVSRNAFYSLARKDSILPNSIRAIAASLGIKPADILEDEDAVLPLARIIKSKSAPGREKDLIVMKVLKDALKVKRSLSFRRRKNT